MKHLGQDKQAILAHYERDAKIYDFNRRFFLFGRKTIINEIGARLRGSASPRKILEVGCGTGANLARLNDLFPHASIHGIDLSQDMLAIASHRTRGNPRITLAHQSFGHDPSATSYDLIHFSYVLSTIPDLHQSLDLAREKLNPSGHVSIVDFHSSRHELFKRWISHSIPIRTEFPEADLEERFTPVSKATRRAYLGAWKYFWFVGRKR